MRVRWAEISSTKIVPGTKERVHSWFSEVVWYFKTARTCAFVGIFLARNDTWWSYPVIRNRNMRDSEIFLYEQFSIFFWVLFFSVTRKGLSAWETIHLGCVIIIYQDIGYFEPLFQPAVLLTLGQYAQLSCVICSSIINAAQQVKTRQKIADERSKQWSIILPGNNNDRCRGWLLFSRL